MRLPIIAGVRVPPFPVTVESPPGWMCRCLDCGGSLFVRAGRVGESVHYEPDEPDGYTATLRVV